MLADFVIPAKVFDREAQTESAGIQEHFMDPGMRKSSQKHPIDLLFNP